MPKNTHDTSINNSLSEQKSSKHEEEYDKELELCKAAGADIDELRALKFNKFQLVEIRKGLEYGLDVSKYMDPALSWTEMEERRKEMKQSIDMTTYREQDYDTAQLAEIRRGIAKGLDVSQYDDKKYFAEQMREIRLGLEAGIPVIFYQDPQFDSYQMAEIRKGIEEGLDISTYATSDIPYMKMRVIRESLMDGLTFDRKYISLYDSDILEQLHKAYLDRVEIEEYVRRGYDADQIEEIRIAITEKLPDIDLYMKIEMRGESLREIRLGLESGLDVALFAKPEYSWQQMHELRLGLEHQIDISQYSKALYLPAQMREIRLGIENNVDITQYNQMIYTAKEMRALREWMESGRLIPEDKRIVFDTDLARQKDIAAKEDAAVWKFLQGDGGDYLDVSNDQMKCYITLPPVPDADTRYTMDFVMTLLFKAHVRRGIDRDIIEDMLRNKVYGVKTLVAQGKDPVDGSNGYYEYFISRRGFIEPRFMEDGSADFSECKLFQEVKLGEKIALYHRASKGTDGYTVAGKIIKSKGGRELPIIKGTGIMVLNDKLTYVTIAAGALKVSEDNITVTKFKEIDGVSGESIDYEGTLVVNGDVEEGSSINCTGDLMVRGRVISADINVKGDAIFVSGVTGNSKDRSTVFCEGIVAGNNFEWTNINGKKSLFANECINCQVYCEGKIVAFGENGIIKGGVYQSLNGLETATLGSKMVTDTIVETGIVGSLREEYEECVKDISRVQEELKGLEIQKDKFSVVHDSRNMNILQLKIKINAAVALKENELAALVKQKSEIDEEIKRVSNAKVIVNKEIFGSTSVTIDGIIRQIHRYRQSPRGFVLQKQGKEVEIEEL